MPCFGSPGQSPSSARRNSYSDDEHPTRAVIRVLLANAQISDTEQGDGVVIDRDHRAIAELRDQEVRLSTSIVAEYERFAILSIGDRILSKGARKIEGVGSGAAGQRIVAPFGVASHGLGVAEEEVTSRAAVEAVIAAPGVVLHDRSIAIERVGSLAAVEVVIAALDAIPHEEGVSEEAVASFPADETVVAAPGVVVHAHAGIAVEVVAGVSLAADEAVVAAPGVIPHDGGIAEAEEEAAPRATDEAVVAAATRALDFQCVAGEKVPSRATVEVVVAAATRRRDHPSIAEKTVVTLPAVEAVIAAPPRGQHLTIGDSHIQIARRVWVPHDNVALVRPDYVVVVAWIGLYPADEVCHDPSPWAWPFAPAGMCPAEHSAMMVDSHRLCCCTSRCIDAS